MGLVDETERWLREELPGRASEHQVPGASVAVFAGGRAVEAASGVINLRTGVEVTPDALFMIQSITKVWTATLVMQLVDEGRVELDAPIRTYLPAFTTADREASGRVSVRHLLTHTGGFEGDLWAATTCGEDALQRFVEDLVSQARQYTEPGMRYSYSNSGYGVLGRLVEVLRGTSYAGAVRSHLTRPLGIDEVAFRADDALLFRTAVGHASPGPGAALRPLSVWAVLPASNPAAGNQLAMSARSLLAFGRMHLDDGMASDGSRILSPASARAMREWQLDIPALLGPRRGHGLGWMLADPPGTASHGGDTIGIVADLHLVPERGVAVAVLTNGGDAGALIGDLAGRMLSDLAGVAPEPPPPTPPADARVDRPERFAGRYETRVSIYDVTVEEGGRLWVTHRRQHEGLSMFERAGVPSPVDRFELRPAGAQTFLLVDSSGAGRQSVEFFDVDRTDRLRFLHHSGRAAMRVDAPR